MIRDADGPLKEQLRSRRVRLHRREEHRRRPGRARASASTARSGSTARRAACSSATSARSWATSRPFPTRSPTTACSRSASSPPRAAGSGRERSRAPPSGNAPDVAVRRDRARPEVRHPLREADPLRARRRRSQEDAPAAHQGLPRRDHGVRPGGDAVSTATPVPETWELTGDDARRVLARRRSPPDPPGRVHAAARRRRIQSRALARVRDVARCSCRRSSRSSASRSRSETASFSRVVVRSLQGGGSGPGRNAPDARRHAGASRRSRPIATPGSIFGLVGSLITGSTLVGQLERGLNRIYGIEQDRPTLQKYGRALALTVTVGHAWRSRPSRSSRSASRSATRSTTAPRTTLWHVVRWPVGGRARRRSRSRCSSDRAPRRRQPSLSWLAFGAGIAADRMARRDGRCSACSSR